MGNKNKKKGPHTCLNLLMNMDHRKLDVLYISTLVRPLVRAELFISISAIQAVVQQIIGTYSCTYRKAWLARQRVIVDLFGDCVTSYNMLPSYMDAVYQKNPDTIVVWPFENGPHPLPTLINFKVFSGHSGRLLRASELSSRNQHRHHSLIWQIQ